MNRFFLFTFIAVLNYYSIIFGSDFLKTQGRIIINEHSEKVLLKGFGLGGWLVLEGYMWNCNIEHASTTRMENSIIDLVGENKKNEFFNVYRKNYITEKEISFLSEQGFNALRIPLHHRDFSPNLGQFISTGFEILDPIIELCREYGIYIILDMHAAPGAQNSSDFSDSELNGEAELFTEINNQRWLASTWRYIAEYYSEETVIGAFDLLNEPVIPWGYGPELLRNIYERTIDSIRTVDPNHIVIIEGNWYGNDHTGLFPPFDDNMVYSFHHYVGGSTDTTTMYNQYRTDISLEYNVPLWVGEFGENSNYWGHNIKNFFERNDIGWSWWNFKSVERISSLFSYDITNEYQILIDYWQQGGIKPDTNIAFNGLMSMANSIQFDSCRINLGLSMALIDTSYYYYNIPFSNFSPPGLLPSVNYDIGNNEIAYFDFQVEDPNKFQEQSSAWNDGWSYRNDGVDIQKNEINGREEYYVCCIEDDEWMRYTINSNRTGNFKVMAEVSSFNSGSKLSVQIDTTLILGPINIPNTNGWTNWRIIDIGYLPISNKTDIIILANNGGFNLKNIIFEELDVSLIPMELKLNCYPNPNNSILKIAWESNFILDTELNIYDLLGNKVLSDIVKSNKGLNQYDWYFNSNGYSHIPSGIYFVNISTINAKETKKITYIK